MSVKIFITKITIVNNSTVHIYYTPKSVIYQKLTKEMYKNWETYKAFDKYFTYWHYFFKTNLKKVKYTSLCVCVRVSVYKTPKLNIPDSLIGVESIKIIIKALNFC